MTPHGQLTVTSHGQLTATLHEQLTATLHGQLTATLHGQLTATLQGQLIATPHEQLTVTPHGQHSVTPRGELTVTPHGCFTTHSDSTGCSPLHNDPAWVLHLSSSGHSPWPASKHTSDPTYVYLLYSLTLPNSGRNYNRIGYVNMSVHCPISCTISQ